jgi:hypothetical protein
VVDGLLASTLVDVAWMAEAVNVQAPHNVPGFPAASPIWRANYGLIMARRLARHRGLGASAMHNEAINKRMRDSVSLVRFL